MKTIEEKEADQMKFPINLMGKDINNEEITIEITNIKHLRLERQNLLAIEDLSDFHLITTVPSSNIIPSIR